MTVVTVAASATTPVGIAASAVAPVGIVASAVMMAAAPAARADETVRACGVVDAGAVNRVFGPAFVEGIATFDHCATGGGLQLNTTNATVGRGQFARWQANAPAGLAIVLVAIPPNGSAASDVNTGDDYGGGLYWAGGGRPLGTSQNSTGASAGGFSSGYVGFDLACEASPCQGLLGRASLAVSDIGMQVHETQAPYLADATGLWQAQGYVRGAWPLSFTGDSPAGVCSLSATIDGQTVGHQDFPGNDTVWHQCAATGLATSVNTAEFASGAHALTLHGADAALLVTPDASYTHQLLIDNQQPTVSLSGAADAPSSAGTQYLTTTGAAGPSGVSGISCTVDGASESFAGASVRIPVVGVGVHHVSCAAANNSRDTSLAVAVSAPTSHTISIRQPTAFAVSFSQIRNALRCHLQGVRVRVPGRVVTIRRHHKLVHVRRRGHTKVVSEKRCHAPVVYRRVAYFVTVHGRRTKHYKRVREVLTPRTVTTTTKRVAYGHATTINGVLLANDGAPLSGQTVQVLSAPDDGQGHFTQAATTGTDANGDWSARLPAGPSRLVEAFYAGAALTEPSVSAQVRVVVPARVRLLSVTPRRLPARGGTVHIVGQLDGGYLPAAGVIVEVQIGVGKYLSSAGVKTHVTGSGRFIAAYTFGPAHHAFFFQLKSLPAGDYPYAPARSGRVSVIVGM